ncbi:GNAT family N-acetyltransferase [Paenibacillus agricola]|uniref:N-acetyltransferase n=1 Tax=Paenibacillus agricola TaxID=2716264 RepID=A0ABX0J7X9_9BACL|nr:GNAT family N-acetyltransferase [Paenibacillus agricola]NHN32480.1 N-acetyltransferase [Paenibacillus agricola]
MNGAHETNGTNELLQDEISVQKQGNSFVLIGIGGTVGEITYKLADVDTWVIDHTYLDPEYRGRNIGKRLLDLVVDEAREMGRKIVPSCSYALEQFKANPEYADVWERSDTQFSDTYSSSSVTTPRN